MNSAASPELDMLRWQFDLAWRLCEYHLPHVTDEMCFWKPAPSAWSVQRDERNNWRPDWADTEPNPAPPTTIGWLTWHLIWWWSGLIAAVRGESVPGREQVLWPGNAAATIARLRALRARWSAELQRLDSAALERPLAYPWESPRPLRMTVAWANAEMMKNAAEIGLVRHLFEARRATQADVES